MSLEQPQFPQNPQPENPGEDKRPPVFELPVIHFDEPEVDAKSKGEVPNPDMDQRVKEELLRNETEADWSKMTSAQILVEVAKRRGQHPPNYFEEVPPAPTKLTKDGLLAISTGYLRATPGKSRQEYLREESARLGFPIDENEILNYIEKVYPITGTETK